MTLPRAATLTEAVGSTLRQKMVALVDPIAAALDASWIFVGPPASGSASGKDKAKVLAAIDEAKALAKGGLVQFGPGTYDVGDLAILLPDWNVAGKSITLKGAGIQATTLKRSVDGAVGTYFIAGDGPTTANFFNLIEDMAIVGPGVLGALNTSPADMSGVRLDTQTKMHRVIVSLFRHGIDSAGNHSVCRDVETANNFDGLHFSVTYGLGGDIILDNCKLSGNRRSSISVKADRLATFTMIKGHVGFAPYCVYFEGNPANVLSLGGTQFIGTSFEYTGNSFFYSADKLARIDGLDFYQTGNYSRNFATYGISTITTNPGFYVKEIRNCRFIGGLPPGVSDGPLFDVAGIFEMTTDRWKASYDASVASAQTWMLVGNTAPKVRFTDMVNGSAGFLALPSVAVAAGQVLEHRYAAANYQVVPYGNYGAARGIYAGIAFNASASAASRVAVVVITQGDRIPVQIDSAAASSYHAVPSTATAGKATGIAYDGTNTGGRPLVGDAYFGALPTGGGTADMRVGT